LHKWQKKKHVINLAKKTSEDLTDAGATRQMALKIQRQEEEIAAYQKKVAEQSVIIDLLKKLQTPRSYQSESKLSGLIDTIKKSDRK